MKQKLLVHCYLQSFKANTAHMYFQTHSNVVNLEILRFNRLKSVTTDIIKSIGRILTFSVQLDYLSCDYTHQSAHVKRLFQVKVCLR